MQYSKKGVRLIALATVVLLVLALTACPGSGSSKGSGGSQSGPPMPDLNGYEFTVIDFNSTRWAPDASNPTPYSNARQQMIDNVEASLNCKITAMPSASPGDIITAAQPAIMSGDKYADLICTTQWAYGYFMAAGLMQDLNELNCNWDASWWNQNIRQMSTVQGKTYAANGSFIFDAAQTWLLYFNNTIWNELGLPDPYQLVYDGKWTIDLFAQYAKMAMMDNNGDGVVKSAEDRWGIVTPGGDFIKALYLSSGNHYFEEVDGKVQLALNKSSVFDFLTKARKIFVTDKSAFTNGTQAEGQTIRWYVQSFVDSHALFLAYMPGVEGLTDMQDDWGVLPMPKASEDQPDYLSGVDHNSVVCGVTITNQDLDKVGPIMDALGYYGKSLEDIYWPDYKETYWRHEGVDADIVKNYVAHHGQYDLAMLLQRVKNCFIQPFGLVSGAMTSYSDFSSLVQSVQDQINYDVQAYFSGTSTTAPSG